MQHYFMLEKYMNKTYERQYFSTTIPLTRKTNQLNPITISNSNRLSAVLTKLDEGEGGELR